MFDIIHHHHPKPVDDSRVLKLLEILMADFSKLHADVTAQNSVVAGVSTLLSQLSTEIAALKTAGNSDAATQAAIDDLAQKVEANSAALSQAVTANTPAS